MNDKFSISPLNILKLKTENELSECNEFTVKFGLYLNKEQIQNICEQRIETLKNTGRIEFRNSILKELIFEFCDSPYISQDNYEEIIIELLESFYYFKGEAMELLSDGELLKYMRKFFDDCEGSMDYLNGTSLDGLCHYIKHNNL